MDAQINNNEDWIESKRYLHFDCRHILVQIEEFGYFKSVPLPFPTSVPSIGPSSPVSPGLSHAFRSSVRKRRDVASFPEESSLLSSKDSYQNIESSVLVHYMACPAAKETASIPFSVSSHSHPSAYSSASSSSSTAAAAAAAAAAGAAGHSKEALWLGLTVLRIDKIDIKEESFSAAFHITLMWKMDLSIVGLSDLSKRAQESNHYIVLSAHDRARFKLNCTIPPVDIYNSISIEQLESSTEIYIFNGSPHCNYVVYRCEYHCKIHCFYDLHCFPYDVQRLVLRLRITSIEIQRKLKLNVFAIHISKYATRMTEWKLFCPIVKRSSVIGQCSVTFQIQRFQSFYIQNFVWMMFVLEFLGLSAFLTAAEPNTTGSRARLTVTLMLTMVALKFSFESSLPSTPYHTLLGLYFTIAANGLAIMTFFSVLPQFFRDDVLISTSASSTRTNTSPQSLDHDKSYDGGNITVYLQSLLSMIITIFSKGTIDSIDHSDSNSISNSSEWRPLLGIGRIAHSDQASPRFIANMLLLIISFVFTVGGLIGWFVYCSIRSRKDARGLEELPQLLSSPNLTTGNVADASTAAVAASYRSFYSFRFCSAPFLDNTVLDRSRISPQ